MFMRQPTAKAMKGMTLLESLVSLLILAVGVLGLLGVQLRTLAETQTSVRRAQAVRAIEDLGERIKSNPGGFARLSSYAVGWSDPGTAPTADCRSAACSSAQLAQRDVWEWKSSVKNRLPMGAATVFLSSDEAADNKRQLGVMVAWRANEGSAAANYLNAFSMPATGTANATCPEGHICHLAYVQP